MIVVIKMCAYIHGGLFCVGAYYPDFTVPNFREEAKLVWVACVACVVLCCLASCRNIVGGCLFFQILQCTLLCSTFS